MTIIEILFTACLIASPDQCEPKALQFAENVAPMACLMQAQPYLAQWTTQHPKWRVTEWRCQQINETQRKDA